MEKLSITGTSSLLPKNKVWNSLLSLYHIDFGEYGDWFDVFSRSKKNKVLWVVFLEDLIPPEQVSKDSVNSFNQKLETVFSPLFSHLKKSMFPTLVVFSTTRPDSIINCSKKQTKWQSYSQIFCNHIYDLARKFPNLFLIPIDQVYAKIGIDSCFDSRNFYLSRCRMSIKGLECLVDAVGVIFNRLKQPPKKVLILDCDNTLWGGVIGESGLSGIKLGTDGIGQAFSDFQMSIKRQFNRGVLLAISSKNSESDVWDVFENHHGMNISKKDLVNWKINWDEKAENVKEMSDELGLGLDSFVFWDDNPLEREKMKLLLPEVEVVEIPDEVTDWASHLDSLDSFSKFLLTKEDKIKTVQYKQRSLFVKEKKQTADQTEFLKSIKLKPSLVPLKDETLARAEQLCMKTNQFNLNLRRYDSQALKSFSLNKNFECKLISLIDRFGDHGIIGLAIIEMRANIAFLDTFLMSCRVLGRHLELWFMDALVKKIYLKGVGKIIAQYTPTERNQIVSRFLKQSQFSEMNILDNKNEKLISSFDKKIHKDSKYFVANFKSINIPNLEIFE
tara:strand:- start:2266 stop:3942 length:1677 start_codon:yes stop_codon:yes gene_type:complete